MYPVGEGAKRVLAGLLGILAGDAFLSTLRVVAKPRCCAVWVAQDGHNHDRTGNRDGTCNLVMNMPVAY